MTKNKLHVFFEYVVRERHFVLLDLYSNTNILHFFGFSQDIEWKYKELKSNLPSADLCHAYFVEEHDKKQLHAFFEYVVRENAISFSWICTQIPIFCTFLAFHNILNENLRNWSLIYHMLICHAYFVEKHDKSSHIHFSNMSW